MANVRRLPVFRTIDDAYLERTCHSGHLLRLTLA